MKKTDLSKAFIAGCVLLMGTGWAVAENWPGWRGDGRGLSTQKNLPLKWSENKGVKWKTPIGGAGHSSAIVWGNRVFVTTAVAEDPNVESFRGGVYMGGNRKKPDESQYAYHVICLDADQGSILWSKAVARQSPRTRRHTKNTYASETPVTDGKYVFASFGPAGLYTGDFEGNVIWYRDLGLMRVRAGWGTGCSPVLFQNTVIMNCDSDDDEVYIQTEDGKCYVVKQGPEFEILAVNKLDEVFCASAAVSGGKLFLRGRKHLYCVGK